MGGNSRLLLRRARSQQTLLLAVLAVALVGATVLGTFALLLATSQHHMLAVALDRTSAADREIDVTLTLTSGEDTGAAAVEHGTAFLDQLLGDVPASREEWLSSVMYSIQGTDDPIAPYAYLASTPRVQASSTLLSGEFPTTGVDEQGRIPVAVPQVVADEYGWTVGSVVDVKQASSRDPATFVVTGTFALTGPAANWERDELKGVEHDPSYPVLGSAGFLQTQAWGPFVVGDAAVLTDGAAPLGVAHLVAHPELTDAPTRAVDGLRVRLDDAQQQLAAATASDGLSSYVATRLPGTIDAAGGSLQVTRVTLVVVALMLVTLAVTVLLLAARMLADRRVPEQTLMASRGASHRQILWLAVLEALAIALVTAVVSPFLAVLTYRALAFFPAVRRGGLDIDPGRPALLWLTCALAAVLLAGVLVGPLLRRGSSEQPSARQERRGSAARSGADVALVVLAGIALWQLRSYRSPVGSTSSGLGGIDPVLVLAPALVLLAGAVLALRLMPVVAHVGERLAARSRAWVSPLAVWELGRRPARATAAVLLLTLSVGVGAFSSSFLATWRTSQLDQTDLAVGADVRATPTPGAPMVAASRLAAVPGIERAAPVTFRDVTIGTPSANSRSGAGGVPTTLLAVDTTHADELLRGRVPPGWGARTAPLRPAEPATGIALPGTPAFLVVDLASGVSSDAEGTILSALVLQDPSGARTTLQLPGISFERTATDVVLPIPAAVSGLQLVGVVARAVPDPTKPPPRGDVVANLRVENLRVASGSTSVSEPPAVEDLEGVESVSLTADWSTSGSGAGLKVTDDSLRLSATIAGAGRFGEPVDLTAVTFADPSSGASNVQALVTPDVLETLGNSVGDQLLLTIDGASIRVVIAGTVPYLPGQPSGRGVILDEDLLGREVVMAGSSRTLADEWWLEVPDDQAETVAATLAQDGTSTVVRVEEREAATDGPLRVGIQAALWIVVVAALALAVSGLAMSAAVTVRSRRLEFARLQALGAPRAGLVRSVLVEHAILGTVGVVVGLALGALLAHVVAPLITTSASGQPPVPDVLVEWDWGYQLALVGALVLLVALVVGVTTSTLLKRASGELLRLGDER
ncbi:FtsX-like permease family protein [Cellulomonas sp. PhB150]|uniref:ABC transporter permease n=1 Tax=Cellulomonas sp. PhB150 TaxID=2485188 RepID=UPI000F47C41F|nr:FtsX-like permease family protein [Cellulomonas sp. PhB150]ROS23039.1 FtsX-like permease family protein [Cellulomonas sp. PhB150]